MNIKRIAFLIPLFLAFLAEGVRAHCPLCTLGAAAAAGGASYLGVNNAVIGIFIGAFAVSLGWWIAGLIKKQYIPFQKTAIILFSFATTVIPLMPIIDEVFPLFILWTGDYGSLLNRTYVINLFLAGSILGGIIVSITPWMSKKITGLRSGKLIPYQGTSLTLILLIAAGVVIQIIT